MKKGNYVDGFVLTIPKKSRGQYKKIAQKAAAVWKKYGALDYKECRIEDAQPSFVTFTFAKMAKAKPDEEVWFSYIVFNSRKHRDAVNKKVMAYMEKNYDEKDMQMPFDMKRFAYAGFAVEVGM